jgi:sigma-B regulation protein RsbU (phosphoserine phosphatase)
MTRPAARRNSLELERQRDLLRRQQERDQRVLSALYNISLACRERPDFRAIFETLYRELATVFSFDAAYIAFCDERPEYFKCAYLVDEGQGEYLEQVEYGYLSGAIVHSGQPMLFRDLVYERDPSQPRVPFGNEEKRSRSWLGVPLMIGSESVGVVSIQSYEVGIYNETHQDLLQRMANVIAVALENVALIERQGRLSAALAAQVAARNAEIAALSTIAAALVERRPLADLLNDAIGVALDLFQLDAGNVRLLDERREALVLQAQRGFPPGYVARTVRSPLASSPIREVVEQSRPQVTEQGWHTRVDRTRPPFDIFPPFEASLSLPLSIGAVVTGTLSLFGLAPRSFDEHEISLARAVANQIAIIVENTRLLDERERQIAELRALSEVSGAASTARDIRTLLGQVHASLHAFIPLDVFSMVVYDPERGVVLDGLTIDDGQIYEYWTNQQPPPSSLTARILRTGEGLRFGDLPSEILDYPGIELAVTGAERPARSWLGVPLRDRDGRIIGQINVQGYTPQLFGARDELFLHNVAAQVALHVQNVRLLAQRERQIAELEAIGQVGKVVTASFELDPMLAEIHRVFSDLTGASVFALLICEPESGIITNAVFVEQGEWVPMNLVGHKVAPGSMSDWILTHREPLLFQDLVEQRHELRRRGIEPRPIGPANPVRSWAGVPVVARDGELIGVLSIQDYRAFRYDSQTIDFLSQVASHISLGVQKVRLFAERDRLIATAQAHAEGAERQAHRMELVNRIASVLSARLDQQEILEIAARELVQLFWADHTGTVLLTSPDTGLIVAEYPDTGIVGMTLDLQANPIVATIAETRRPVIISDFDHDPLAAQSKELWRSLGIQSLAIVPLVSRDRVVGTISLDSYRGPLIFTDDELELMQTVATSIAAAVENAQLFAAEQEQRRTADTLREMARVLSSSFDPNEVLRLVLGELHKLIPYDTASIMLLDGLQLRMVAARQPLPPP